MASGSGWNLWVWLVGVVSGCGCKEVYRFSLPTTPTYVYLFFFAAASLLFVHVLNVFRSCSGTFL